MKNLLKALLLLFCVELMAGLVMVTIGEMYNLPVSGTTFVEIFALDMVALSITGAIGIMCLVYTILFKPEILGIEILD